jgi:hypothetical protein
MLYPTTPIHILAFNPPSFALIPIDVPPICSVKLSQLQLSIPSQYQTTRPTFAVIGALACAIFLSAPIPLRPTAPYNLYLTGFVYPSF